MKKRPNKRYSVNRLLLLSTLGVLVIALPLSFVWYKYRLRQTSSALLVRAEQLEEKEDWAQATGYYQRYLLLEPDNTEVLIKMVEAFAHAKPSRGSQHRLNALLYQVLGRAPARDDLRGMLAENLIRTGEFEQAELEAKKLLDKTPELSLLGRKVIARSLLARARDGGSISNAQAIEALIPVAKESPEDIELVEIAADALRRYPGALASSEIDSATLADQLMNEMVAADPQNVEARLARCRYRIRYQLGDISDDLQAVLDGSPDNPTALILSAGTIDENLPAEERRSQAEGLLRRAIGVAPDDPRGYLALAALLERSGDSEQALTVLEAGRRETNQDFELGLALVQTQVKVGKLKEAEGALRELESQLADYLVEAPGKVRSQVENRFRLLHARLELNQGKTRSAVQKLQAILLATEATDGLQRSLEWSEACQLLAQVYSQAGQWDQASEFWGKLAGQVPGNAAIVAAAVGADLKAGKANEALRKLDEFRRHAQLTEDLLVSLLQAQLTLQLDRASKDRNWTEFEQALGEAKKGAPGRFEPIFAELRYLSTREDTTEAAANLLRAAETTFASNRDFWRNAASAYQELGKEADLERAVTKHHELAASRVEDVTLRTAILTRSARLEEAETLLKSELSSTEGEERQHLQRLLVRVLALGNKGDQALSLVSQLVKEESTDPETLTLGIEIAIRSGRPELAEEWETTLQNSSAIVSDTRTLRARRLLQSYDQLTPSERQNLESLISGIRGERPKWFPIVALAAQYAELKGDSRQALLDYELAIELGDRSPHTILQAVTLLFEYRQLEKAQDYLSRLANDQSTGALVDALSVELAERQDRVDVAIALAKKSVERFPNDAMRRVTLGNLLVKHGKPKEAVEVLRDAARTFGNDTRVLLGLFTAFTQAGMVEDARQTLAAIAATPGPLGDQRYFVVAQGYEILGDRETARKYYERAIAEEPNESAIRLKFAKMLRASDPRSARLQYQEVRKLDPENTEALRELAILLAASGQESDWNEANELLKSLDNASSDSASTNDRLRAILISRKGRTRKERIDNCQAARTIMQRRIESDSSEANELNRTLLSQILEQEAAYSEDPTLILAARDQHRLILDSKVVSAENLVPYIEFLLRHASNPKTAASQTPGAETDTLDNSRMKDDFLQEAEARIEELKRLPSDTDGHLDALTVAFTVRALQARGQTAEAKARIDEFVTRQTEGASSQDNLAQKYLLSGRLYSLIGASDEAEKWYRRTAEMIPNAYVLVAQSLIEQGKREDAAKYCLNVYTENPIPEVATHLATIMATTDQSPVELPEVQAAMESALQKHGDNSAFLQSEAVRLASLGRYDEAISLFRKILQLEPNNVLALNNLATLLAEKPNQRAEALEQIDKAIEIAGREASLLDTQGTIHLKRGDAEQAIACLEEATAGGATDARYYLHLAAAYQLAKREQDAVRMLQESRAFGIEKFVLTGDDRQLLADLDEQLSGSRP